MARRYATYEQLKDSSGVWVPPSCLGNHFANVFVREHSIVVSGSRGGSVTLRPGDTLGYNIGHVWVVPRPDSYRDPLRRILAELRIPQRVLETVDVVEVEVPKRGNFCTHRAVHPAEWHYTATDGKETVVSCAPEVLEHSNQYHVGCPTAPDIYKVEGGTFCISYADVLTGGGWTRREINRVIVTRGVDRNMVIAKLLELKPKAV